jgi:CHAT domain-containing protein
MREQPTRPDSALVVGVPDERAPRIGAEAREVASALRTNHLLLGTEASAQRFKESASQAEIIHLACHGQFSATNPLSSGLRFADRWLTLAEIYELPLHARLVIFSGCETGRGKVGSGDELVGLVRGFIAAGAAALVVSLWTVNDESTGKLMSAFYNQVAGVREDRQVIKALRAAQLESLSDHPHPAFWAPFILIGAA